MADIQFFTGWTTVVDTDTRVGIAGAMVFVAGKAYGPTDATGKVWVGGTCGVVFVRIIKAPTYNTPLSLTVTPTQVFPTTLNAQKVVVAARPLTFKTTPGNILISLYSVTGAGTRVLLEAVLCDAGGVGHTTHTYAANLASLLVVQTKTGYQTKEDTLVLRTDVNEYTLVGPDLLTDGSQEGASASPVVGPRGVTWAPPAVDVAGSPLPLVESASQFDYEWIVPNSQDGKYFTTTQARMYIGNLFIDELNTVQFAYQGNRIPIYGYCSEDLDAIGSGRRLVQGQILINFISEGYLYTVLREHQRLLADSTQMQDAVAKDARVLVQLRTHLEQLQAIPRSLITDATQKDLDQTNQTIIRLTATNGPGLIDAAKVVITDRDRLVAGANAITLKTPFTIVLDLEGGGRKVTRTLEQCVLTSNEQVYDQSGQTLLDAYGFIARRLR